MTDGAPAAAQPRAEPRAEASPDTGPETAPAARRGFARPHATIGGRLLALLVMAAAPILALMLTGVVGAWQEGGRRFDATLSRERDIAADHIATELALAQALLGAMAMSLPADRLDGPGCGEALVQVAGLAPAGISFLVTDRAGQPRCLAGEADSLPVGNLSSLRAAGQVLVAEDASGLVLAMPLSATEGLVALRMPSALLLHDGMAAPAAWLLRPGEAPALPLTAPARGLPPPGLPFAAAVRRELHDLPVGTATLRVATAPLGPGLALALARPAGPELAARWWRALADLLQIAALLGFCLAAVALGARYTVVVPLQRLHEAVRRWRTGRGFEPGYLSDMPAELRDLAEAFRNAAVTLAQQEQELRAALESRELLMAEVHHRVKNNLQVVSSLLNLQSQRIREPGARAEFEAARDRVQALATLHRHLYAHHDHETIDLAAFIGELGGQLFAAAGERPGGRIALKVEAPSLRISSDQAVPLALIITEAVSNALKFAFPGTRRGTIEIRLAAEERRARLVVRDDGVGRDEAVPDRPGLGGQLLRALGRQLGGSLVAEEGPGTALRLDFPLRPPVARPPPALRRPPPGPAGPGPGTGSAGPGAPSAPA